MPIDAPASSPGWLVLIHHFPQDPGALRVKVWRRLQALGAVAIKNSVYVLPKSDESLEDFQWLLRLIVANKAEAVLLESRFIEGLSDPDVRHLFDAAREADYDALAEEIRALGTGRKHPIPDGELRGALARFRKRLGEIEAIDYFGANGREAAAALIAALAAGLSTPTTSTEKGRAVQKISVDALKNRIWVTRRNVHVDRMATAWLVRRWIDPEAVFKFTDQKTYRPEEREVRFDMFEAEYTHEGERCTFEVLLNALGLDDSALGHVAEIVHDIDLKDQKYGHDETAGVASLLAGIVARNPDDAQRIERGCMMFDDLYQSTKVFRK